MARLTELPPHRDQFDSIREWSIARKAYFKNLKDKIKWGNDTAPAPEPSPQFLQLVLPNEQIPAARKRLSAEYDYLAGLIADHAATSADKDRHSELFKIHLELRTEDV